MPIGHTHSPPLLNVVRDIRLSKQRYDSIATYYWDHYCYFAHQRSLIFDDLKIALAKVSQQFWDKLHMLLG